jgi:hypothetical protein
MLTKLFRAITVAVLAAGAAVVSPQQGWADPIDPVYCDQNPIPGCVVRVKIPGRSGDSRSVNTDDRSSSVCHDPGGTAVPCYIEGRGSLGSGGCYYQTFDNGPPPADAKGPGAWYVRSCHDQVSFGPLGVPLGGDLVWIPDGDASLVSPEVLAQQAVSRLDLPSPVIHVNPLLKRAGATRAVIVHVPTWLWVDAAAWRSRSATASAGGISVTATATPTGVEWSTGDGGVVPCKGPGKPWRAGMDPSKPSSCGHTYTTATTAGRTYALRATLSWEITWAGGGATGAVPALSTTAGMDLEVMEAGALNNGQAKS